MPLAAGTQLGPYGILSALGAGGMGGVYRAHAVGGRRLNSLGLLGEGQRDDS